MYFSSGNEYTNHNARTFIYKGDCFDGTTINNTNFTKKDEYIEMSVSKGGGNTGSSNKTSTINFDMTNVFQLGSYIDLSIWSKAYANYGNASVSYSTDGGTTYTTLRSVSSSSSDGYSILRVRYTESITFKVAVTNNSSEVTWTTNATIRIYNIMLYEDSIDRMNLRNDIGNNSTFGTGISYNDGIITASGSTANQRAMIFKENLSKYLNKKDGKRYLYFEYTCSGNTFKIAGSNTTSIGGALINQKTLNTSTNKTVYMIELEKLISYAHPYLHILLTNNSSNVEIKRMWIIWGYPNFVKGGDF